MGGGGLHVFGGSTLVGASRGRGPFLKVCRLSPVRTGKTGSPCLDGRGGLLKGTFVKVREATYLITARTKAAECVPVFSTRSREGAMSKAHNVNTAMANDAARRLGLPAGELVDVGLLEFVNGTPAGIARFTPRNAYGGRVPAEAVHRAG